MLDLSRLCRDLTEHLADDVREFVASRLKNLVEEHERFVKRALRESIVAATSATPTRQPSTHTASSMKEPGTPPPEAPPPVAARRMSSQSILSIGTNASKNSSKFSGLTSINDLEKLVVDRLVEHEGLSSRAGPSDNHGPGWFRSSVRRRTKEATLAASLRRVLPTTCGLTPTEAPQPPRASWTSSTPEDGACGGPGHSSAGELPAGFATARPAHTLACPVMGSPVSSSNISAARLGGGASSRPQLMRSWSIPETSMADQPTESPLSGQPSGSSGIYLGNLHSNGSSRGSPVLRQMSMESISAATGEASLTTTSLRNAHNYNLSIMGLGLGSDVDLGRRSLSLGVGPCPVSLWLRLWGVLPCSAAAQGDGPLRTLRALWNQLLVLLCVLLALVHAAAKLHEAVDFQRLGDLVLALSALGCLAAARTLQGCDLFNASESVLAHYAEQRGFASAWRARSRWQLLEFGLAWLLTVASRLLPFLLAPEPAAADVWVGLEILAFAFVTGVFTATTFCLLHFTSALVRGIDAYSCIFMFNPDLAAGVHEWNVLSAILRRASGAMEACFIVCIIASSLLLFCCAADVVLDGPRAEGGLLQGRGPGRPQGRGPTLLPAVVLGACMGRVLLHAAGVTGHCRRVSPFINSLAFRSAAWMHDRQCLVQYIESSAAGFYIREVPLTAGDALKMVYLGTMAMITIFTKAAAQDFATEG